MLIKSFHQSLIEDREKTYLTVGCAVAATTLTVKAINSAEWADNDFVILGNIGSENCELLQVNGSPSSGTSITIDQSGSGGTRYAHSVDEPLYRISFNQVEFSHASTIGGSKTVLTTTAITPDDLFTRYEDTSNTTGFGFVRFKNSTSTTYSSYSIGVPYTGYPAKSLFKMIQGVKRLLNINDQSIKDEDIADELNEKQRDAYHERLWSFAEATFSISAVANTSDYSLTSRIAPGKVHTLTYDSQPLAKINNNRWEMLHWDTNTTGDPSHFSVFGNRLRVYPISSDSASATTLDGDISATATTIYVNDASAFREPGRVIIGSEVISYDKIDNLKYYGDTTSQFDITNTTGDTYRYTYDGTGTDPGITTTTFPTDSTVKIKAPEMTSDNEGSFVITASGANYFEITNADGAAVTNKTLAGGYLAVAQSSSNTLSGCQRGLEDTTAATHSDGDVVTERDFIGTGHKEPIDLVDMNDETDIPDPRVLEYGAAMELALSKMNDQVLSDRLQIKYDKSLERLRDKFSRKATGSFFSIRDKNDYPSDTNYTLNPQNYPTNISD